jgi:uncharacterized protein YbcI
MGDTKAGGTCVASDDCTPRRRAVKPVAARASGWRPRARAGRDDGLVRAITSGAGRRVVQDGPAGEERRLMGTDFDGPAEANLNREISRALITLVRDFTGRGPKRARTTINGTLIVCLLEDFLTKGESTLVEKGHHDAVVAMRYRFQQAMSVDAISEVERLTGRKVTAFMSTNHIDPDLAAEIFILDEPIG